MSKDLKKKFENLKRILSSMESVLLAYSGGVDSTFLLKVAFSVLNEKVLAVTAESLTFPAQEKDFTKKLAKNLKVKHIFIKTDELKNPNFTKNSKDRCYWCKKELFSKLIKIAKKNRIKYVVEASNCDDKLDYRPGLKAIKELGIRSPLIEAGFRKKDIRKLSKSLKLPTYNKPSLACLASRIPYGNKITGKILARINKAEDYLSKKGFKQVRVRDYGNLARVEVTPSKISKFMKKDLRNEIISYFKKIGYLYITLDLEGYRTGSMNEVFVNKKNR